MSSDKKEPEILTIEDSSGRKTKKIVLDEESFVEKLDKIVERDYFPDLKKLKADNQSFTNKDEEDKIVEDISLGQFLSKYTSEDNASFNEIIKATNKRHQQNYPWFYLDEEEIKLQIENSLNLPSIEYKTNSTTNKQEYNLITWPYRNKNSVMFNPNGQPLTVKEQIEENSKNKQEIAIENTRFRKVPFRRITYKLNTNQTTGSSSEYTPNKQFVQTKYDSTGDIVNTERKEYKLVESTPLIEPNELSTPLMTWGEIESTPLLIEKNGIELESTPSSGRFKIPELSAREQMAIKMTDDFTSKKKKQQQNSNQFSSKRWTPSPLNSPRTPRLEQLSPAVQHFAQSKLRLNIKNDFKNISSSFLHNKSPNLNKFNLNRSSLSRDTDNCSTITDNLLKLSNCKND